MKLIKIPAEEKEKIINDFEQDIAVFREKLKNSDRVTQGFEFKFNPPETLTLSEAQKNAIPRPKIVMAAETYLKMLQYVLKIDIECAWHGFVTRHPENIFAITDVRMYPHKGSAAYVESEDDDYAIWKNGKPDKDNTAFVGGLTDEEMLHLRFQGHSHVNMQTSPSSTDFADQKGFMNELIDALDTYKNEKPEFIEKLNPFYIFAIMNKREDINWFIYDYASGILFEREDIDFITVYNEKYTTTELNEEIATMHRKQTYASNYTNGYGYNYTYTPPKKKDNSLWEIQCKTLEARNKFLECDFYQKNKKYLTAQTDANLGITFFNPTSDETSKLIPWEAFKESKFYFDTFGIIVTETTRPVSNTKKKIDELTKKIKDMQRKKETPYILIDSKQAKFNEINHRYGEVLDLVGEIWDIDFKDNQEKTCFCITAIEFLDDECLKCLLDLQAAGFAFRSIKLEEDPL